MYVPKRNFKQKSTVALLAKQVQYNASYKGSVFISFVAGFSDLATFDSIYNYILNIKLNQRTLLYAEFWMLL